MQESYKIWEVPDKIYDKIGQTTVSQMNDLISEYGLFTENGELSEAEAKNIFDFVVAQGENLKTTLLELGYHEEETSESAIALLKTCLMTRYFVDAQHLRDTTNDRNIIRDLCTYNQALYDAMQTNPEMTVDSLENVLVTSLMWSGTPTQRSRSEDRLVRQTIHGARGELAAQQFATSSYAEAVGISTEATTIDQDLRGIDLIVTVQTKFMNQDVKVRMKMDIKNNLKTVRSLQWDGKNKNYAFDRDRVVMYSQITEEEYGNKVALDVPNLEKYAHAMIPEYQNAARDKLIRNAASMGLVAVAV